MIFFDQRLRPEHSVNASFTTALEGSGSHRVFRITSTISARESLKSPQLDDMCRYFQKYHLPRSYFFDLFELHVLFGDKVHLFGEQDLEDPSWEASGWGSMLLISIEEEDLIHPVTVPFHARYWEPNKDGKPGVTHISAPQVFSACLQQDAAFVDNPWDTFTIKQVILGESNRYRFFMNRGPKQFTIESALASSQTAEPIMWLTISFIVCGFLYICARIISKRRTSASSHDALVVKVKKHA